MRTCACTSTLSRKSRHMTRGLGTLKSPIKEEKRRKRLRRQACAQERSDPAAETRTDLRFWVNSSLKMPFEPHGKGTLMPTCSQTHQ